MGCGREQMEGCVMIRNVCPRFGKGEVIGSLRQVQVWSGSSLNVSVFSYWCRRVVNMFPLVSWATCLSNIFCIDP